MKFALSCLILALSSCASVSPSAPAPRGVDAEFQTYAGAPKAYPSAPPATPGERPEWRKNQTLMQGFIGVSFYDEISREGGSLPDVDGDSGDLDQLPLIGGGAQVKLGGEKFDFGFEGFFSLEGRANAAAFVAGGGGAAVAVDVDLLIVDIYGGPFVSKFLGDKVRVYGSVGPLIQFANYDQEIAGANDSGSGFGVGWYARTGVEFVMASRTMIGLGALWSDSSIDLSGELGDLEIQGTQVFLTLTRGF